MKLALIRRHSSRSGGAEQYIQRLLQALVEAGHQVHLFAEHWEEPTPGVQVVLVPVSGPRSEKPICFAKAVEQLLAATSFDCIFSLERTCRQDVYRAGDGLHRMWLQRRKEFSPWWKRPWIGLGRFHSNMAALEAQTFSPQNTRRIIVNSLMVKSEILKMFDFPQDRIHLVRNGILTERFSGVDRQTCRRRWNIEEKDYVLLFCGSGWERKGLGYLLKALPRHPPYKLLVVGKGRKPVGTPGNVIFAGVIPDVEQAYGAADLFVFPPIYEPSSNVVLEAMAASLPVITSKQNGASELILEGINGSILTDPSDTANLGKLIEEWHRRFQSGFRVLLDKEASTSWHLNRNVKETVEVLELAASERNLFPHSRNCGGNKEASS